MPPKGYKMSEESKRKISEALKGRTSPTKGMKQSPEHIAKRVATHIGAKRSDKTKKKMSDTHRGKTLTDEHKIAISESNKDKHNVSDETRVKLSEAGKGRNVSQETRDKISLSLKGRFRGSNSPNWKGGKYSSSKILRRSAEYIEWRDSVLKRDGYTCVICGYTDTILHTHHIIPLSEDFDKGLDMNNGVTLCPSCHQKEHPNIPLGFRGNKI